MDWCAMDPVMPHCPQLLTTPLRITSPVFWTMIPLSELGTPMSEKPLRSSVTLLAVIVIPDCPAVPVRLPVR